MFIRYVGSGHKGSGRSFSTRGAAVVLLVLLIILFVTNGFNISDKFNVVEDGMYNTVCKLHSYVISSNYNLSSYEEDVTTDTRGKIISNLYRYVGETDMRLQSIKYSYKHPGSEVMFRTTNVNRDDKPEENIVSDNLVDNSLDNQEKQDESETTVSSESAYDDKGIEGYVVPAVATTGVTYTMEQLSSFDFLMAKLYTVPSRALVYESDLVAKDLLAKDMTMQGDNTKPQILIYHTHSQEGFSDSTAGDDATSIVAVGTYLAKILSEEYGYNVIHCTEHFDIAGGKLDRSKAYTYAQGTIEQILQDNPSIEVVLDIHRDGLPEGYDKLLANINGKDVAKIMLFNGISRSSSTGDIEYLYNRHQAENLAFSMKLKLKAMECYPEFTRRNYIDAYQYNLHHRPKSVLVEVGAQNNTLQEALNAMEVFAEVLHRVLSDKK